ncbi:hypothetical protein HRbin03_00233 [archaeon HR03]|uniref:Hypothetical conserved protein n=1 Tax=Caldiarchaeum subterraneum TaxID=311458 RepID=E6N347_CALS0|nr:hypothetical conserved protein [Candidatus Caldarchaeum subterraneum]BAJ49641.1 conserved hypothetical protein [Candidatus Caldarchaeum subterraneum]GBC72404.1 hypothetical protein HRbin03_00233 [archaeon HR03]
MSFVDDWLAETMRHVNDALPRRAEKLSTLLEMEKPSVETVGGGRHYFDKKELEELLRKLPSEVSENLYLPIVFAKNPELGESTYIVKSRGSEAEAFRILMGLRTLPRVGNQPYTYKPLVTEFINRYPTLAVIGYL